MLYNMKIIPDVFAGLGYCRLYT